MQNKITQIHNLLSEEGDVIESGWAKRPILRYERQKVHAGKFRIKEWDYFEIRNPHYGIVLLIYDVGYLANAQVTWIDFDSGTTEEITESVWFSGGSLNLPPGPHTGDVLFAQNGSSWEYRWDHQNHRRIFNFNFPKFRNGAGISGEIGLSQPPEMDTMVNLIPFKKKTQFVYVQKVNCMEPTGSVNVAGKIYEFSIKNNSYGLLDWSRAVFPYHCAWRWATASGRVGGVPFGFNIDYGFGTESSKSMIFYNHRGHHLDEATYSWDEKNVEGDWVFESNDSRVNLTLKPLYVERGGMNYVILKTKVLKVYGFITGEVILDDGSHITIDSADKLFGSAEAVVNYW